MRGPGGLLPLLLIILTVFCSTGFSLTCYHCLNPAAHCKTNITCSPNLDACLYVEAVDPGQVVPASNANPPTAEEVQVFQQCWRFADCDAKFISNRLGLPNLKYSCCQKDFCNTKMEQSGEESRAATLPEKMSLLTTLVLVAGWNLCL